ncbi:MAG: lipoprotein-releasing ABC transporter permease subunit [Gammaproteobacteria bacterium]|nr:lipoprotein-releasing ABC transporter permease subunit [Gammaproteobacteria bacterium]MBV9698366.1 lipoprotein-releasing ABC transporter permease subunit [Gammaproteobacteria bacterium]
MFHPLSLYVGLRYVRARSHKFFVSFITWASLVGVCVGVAALIVILSVMNGFESELRERLLSLGAPVRVSAGGAPAVGADWDALARTVRAVPGVSVVAHYAEVPALAVRQPEMLPVLLRGIDPGDRIGNSELAGAITQGRLADLTPGSERVLVGAVIAERLGLAPGEPLTVLVPTLDANGMPAPKLREFTVAGVFEIGLQDHDGTLLFAHLADVQALGGAAALSEGLRVRVRDVLAAGAVAQRVRARLPPQLEVSDWTRDNANYFRAIRIEKTMMSLILLLIVAVAAFNIVAMLVMVVTDKRTDIAIVRTFGASPARVMAVFITQGLVIGWLGVLLGIGLGLLLAFNVASIVPFLEHAFGFHLMDADVYYITSIPSEVHWSNVATIGLAALALTALATVYPALRAAATAPAEALRYE